MIDACIVKIMEQVVRIDSASLAWKDKVIVDVGFSIVKTSKHLIWAIKKLSIFNVLSLRMTSQQNKPFNLRVRALSLCYLICILKNSLYTIALV